MTQKEEYERFQQNMDRLKRNRDQIPLADLQTRYASAYNSLINEIEEYALRHADDLIAEISPPEHPKTVDANRDLHQRVKAVKDRERGQNGIYRKMKEALINDLDELKYYDHVWELYRVLYDTCFEPYVNSFSRKVTGRDGKEFWWNALLHACWKENPELNGVICCGRYGGAWIGEGGQVKSFEYPPEQ